MASREGSRKLSDRVYHNQGNTPLLALMDVESRRILDVGCGAGDNARLLKRDRPERQIFGVTHSPAEAQIAMQWMAQCWVCDIEGDLPDVLARTRFDAIVFSHVLEHLRDPAVVVRNLCKLLVPGGCVAIAVPNTLGWATRWRFLRGDFTYAADGILDDTHLRFFTYLTADRYLLGKSPTLRLVSKSVTGSVPQWLLRRHVLPGSVSKLIDALGCRLWPNLFGDQVLLKATAVTEQ